LLPPHLHTDFSEGETLKMKKERVKYGKTKYFSKYAKEKDLILIINQTHAELSF